MYNNLRKSTRNICAKNDTLWHKKNLIIDI